MSALTTTAAFSALLASRASYALSRLSSSRTAAALDRPVQLQQSRQISVTPVCMGRKAAKVAQTKNKNDAKRTKLYGKYGKLIVQAVKEGGGETGAGNTKLALVLERARQLSVPRDLIDRNLKRAKDGKQGDFMEMTYEAYGLGGVGIVMEVNTDNVNRANAETRTIVNKSGGKMAEPGSVLFNFERKGIIVLDCPADKEEEVFAIAIEAGADDVKPREDEEPGFVVITDVPAFIGCQRALADAGFTVNGDESALKMIPLVDVIVDDEMADANDAMIEKLLELDDIDAVYTQ
mmetsp:Transcript_14720/g.35573  ORF Transcript_14720/g.35573 Transcript_14720/m.35573 type:complete len:292 (-) Transcript_14720:131-1006(-)|eukprot:CAMPEP_0197584224 /NCGR_PEP_ID=MMETSP1326-20131121/6902_1 /TAXON_ID=1155430 /ORGANISM="Genus nov. species nov., Strain RCC2288" /LENGTH=291 /DNA_ID=CAMNT_0043148561 /DNA_START=149 /DNA_END=1024 /DNA_ORIENTATION=-